MSLPAWKGLCGADRAMKRDWYILNIHDHYSVNPRRGLVEAFRETTNRLNIRESNNPGNNMAILHVLTMSPSTQVKLTVNKNDLHKAVW